MSSDLYPQTKLESTSSDWPGIARSIDVDATAMLLIIAGLWAWLFAHPALLVFPITLLPLLILLAGYWKSQASPGAGQSTGPSRFCLVLLLMSLLFLLGASRIRHGIEERNKWSGAVASGLVTQLEFQAADGTVRILKRPKSPQVETFDNSQLNFITYGLLTDEFLRLSYPPEAHKPVAFIPVGRLVSVQIESYKGR